MADGLRAKVYLEWRAGLHSAATLFVLGALAGVMGCASAVGPTPASESRTNRCELKTGRAGGYIINGQPTNDFPAVGAVLSGSQICTGTLINDTKVLTAAHCISPPPNRFVIGATVDSAVEEIPVASSRAHPNYGFDQTNFDIAIVELVRPPSVRPIPVSPYPPSNGIVGRFVGYGVDNAAFRSGSGTKRVVDITVAGYSTYTITYNSQGGAHACFGDSGGPALLMGPYGWRVAAVASTVNDDFCSLGGTHIRADAFLDFIGPTVPDGPTNSEPNPNPEPNPEPQPPAGLCYDSCPSAHDGVCNDGGSGSADASCAFATDCADCGLRSESVPTPSDPEGTGSEGEVPGGDSGIVVETGCSDTCVTAGDGECDDGGEGAVCSFCAWGSDCSDCGPR